MPGTFTPHYSPNNPRNKQYMPILQVKTEPQRGYTASIQWRLTLGSYSSDFRTQALNQQVALLLT